MLKKVGPIFKGENAELCDNYRPISLQNSIEKMVATQMTQLVNHLEIINISMVSLRGKSKEKT